MCSESISDNKYVVFHKIVERRMDSVAGGALGAFLETFMKEDGYFCAPILNKEFHTSYNLTNDSHEIEDVIDYCITECIWGDMPYRIKKLLDAEKRVLFAGPACHCMQLLNYLNKNYSNLFLIEIKCTGSADDYFVDKYIKEVEKEYGEKVTAIRFRDKEFHYHNSKRITFGNGRTIFIYKTEPFDILLDKNVFIKEKCKECLQNNNERLSDLSIGIYDYFNKQGDSLGYSIVYIHTSKGRDLFEKSLRRLEVFLKGDNIQDELIWKGCKKSNYLPLERLKNYSLNECVLQINGSKKCILFRIKQLAKVCLMIKSSTGLRPQPLYKFFKYNFFRKNTKTDLEKLGYLFVFPYCEFNIAKNAVIDLHGPLFVGGAKRVASSRLETRLWMCDNSKLVVRKKCTFAFGSDIEIFKDAFMDIGDLETANPVTIICGEKIEMGSPVNIAKGTEVRDTNSHLLSIKGFKLNRPITIGNHVWIASNCYIMPGSKIGDGCVIAGVSYVNKKIPNFTIAEGHPAEPKSDLKYFRM